jgi:hypothetical protein
MALTNTSANLGLTSIGTNHPENEAAASSLSTIINNLIAAVDAAIGNVQVLSADGAITITQGVVHITKRQRSRHHPCSSNRWTSIGRRQRWSGNCRCV